MNKLQINYLFDPLCGWCYGSMPMLEQIINNQDFELQLLATGLFSDSGARSLDASFAEYAWQADQRIASLSGQTFSQEYRVKVLQAEKAKLDSTTLTRAFIICQYLQYTPEQQFNLLNQLQQARYVLGEDVTNITAVSTVLKQINKDDIAAALLQPSTEIQSFIKQQLAIAQQLMHGVNSSSVPTLIVNQQLLSSNLLYGDYQQLKQQLLIP